MIPKIKLRLKLLTQCLCVAVLLGLCALAPVRATDEPQVATVDAGIGSCRADFMVKDGSGKALYGAKINVAIKYGFMNMRESDLQDSTNSDGQARFIGLPNF